MKEETFQWDEEKLVGYDQYQWSTTENVWSEFIQTSDETKWMFSVNKHFFMFTQKTTETWWTSDTFVLKKLF